MMRMNSVCNRWPLAILAVAACVPAFGQAASSRFDGAWEVAIDCPSNTEESGAKGYRYRFPGIVANGVLTASAGTDDSPGSLRIDGPIAADGSAEFQARGRTGNPDFAVKHPSSGTRYTYRIKAQFDGEKGTGARIEARVCNFAFAKR